MFLGCCVACLLLGCVPGPLIPARIGRPHLEIMGIADAAVVAERIAPIVERFGGADVKVLADVAEPPSVESGTVISGATVSWNVDRAGDVATLQIMVWCIRLCADYGLIERCSDHQFSEYVGAAGSRCQDLA